MPMFQNDLSVVLILQCPTEQGLRREPVFFTESLYIGDITMSNRTRIKTQPLSSLTFHLRILQCPIEQGLRQRPQNANCIYHIILQCPIEQGLRHLVRVVLIQEL